MPVMTTLGSLTTFKLDNEYWLATIASNSGVDYLFNFYNSNNKIILNTANVFASNRTPLVIDINNPSLYTKPNFGTYQSFNTSNNFTTENWTLIGQGNTFCSLNNNYIASQTQLFGNKYYEVIRVFDSNLNYTSNYVYSSDLGNRFSYSIHANDDNTFITSGNVSSPTETGYVTNYYSNLTPQWEKHFTYTANVGIDYNRLYPITIKSISDNSNNVLLTRSWRANYNNNGYPIVELNSKTGNIVDKFILLNYYTGDSLTLIEKVGNNHFFGTSGGSVIRTGTVGKITNSNTISWQKQLSNTEIMTEAGYYYDGNIYVASRLANSNISPYLSKIINLDANTGNINWVRGIAISGTNEYGNMFGPQTSFLGLKIKNDGMYITWTLGNVFSNAALVFAKFPKDGTILGNGVYTIPTNLNDNITITYTNSNTTLANANLTIVSSNISATTANISNAITSNIAANTTNPTTFNSKII